MTAAIFNQATGHSGFRKQAPAQYFLSEKTQALGIPASVTRYALNSVQL